MGSSADTRNIEDPTDLVVRKPVASEMTTAVEFSSPEAETYALLQRKAQALASSTIIPNDYRNQVGNVLIAMDLAERTQVSPLAVMQNLAIVHGKPSWMSQFVIAVINNSGRFATNIRWDTGGDADEDGKDTRWAEAWVVDPADNCVIRGPRVSMQTARDEGWLNKKDSKWLTIPELMLMYRSASWFGRLYAPDLLIGLPTQDELVDIGASELQQATVTDAPIDLDAIVEGGAAVSDGVEAPGQAVNEPAPQEPVVEPCGTATHHPEGGRCKLGKGHTGAHDGYVRDVGADAEVDPATGEVIPSQEELEGLGEGGAS